MARKPTRQCQPIPGPTTVWRHLPLVEDVFDLVRNHEARRGVRSAPRPRTLPPPAPRPSSSTRAEACYGPDGKWLFNP